MCCGCEGFLRRNGHPHQRLDPETDRGGKALIERFHVDPGQLPIVLCPGGQLLRNPSENELARCIGLVGPIDPNRVYDVAIVGAGPAGSRPRSMRRPKGCRCWCSTAAHSAARPGHRRGSRTIWAFPTGITGMALMARAYNQAQKFGVEMAIPDEATGLAGDPTTTAGRFVLSLSNDERVRARSVVIASGRAIPAARRSQTSRNSRHRACTIGPRRWKASCAPGRRSRWSVPAIPPARRRSIWRARRPRSG